MLVQHAFKFNKEMLIVRAHVNIEGRGEEDSESAVLVYGSYRLLHEELHKALRHSPTGNFIRYSS
jgi:hypothetical protein